MYFLCNILYFNPNDVASLLLKKTKLRNPLFFIPVVSAVMDKLLGNLQGAEP